MAHPSLTPRLSGILRDSLAGARGGLGPRGPRQTVSAVADRMTIEASNMTKMFYAALAMILAAFIVMLFLLVSNAGNPDAFAAISSASGLTFAGLIWFALRTAREATQSALLVLLIVNLPSDRALAALEALLNNREPLLAGNEVISKEKRS